MFGTVAAESQRLINEKYSAFVQGFMPTQARPEVDALEAPLARSHLWHAVRASLLRDLGRDDEALAADLRALELTANEAERRLLAARTGSAPGC